MELLSSDIKSPQVISARHIRLKLNSAPVGFYRHGWQSWSSTAWLDLPSPLPIQKPYVFHAYQTDAVYAREKNPHGSWLGAVEFEDGNILLLGALATDAHVFLLQNQLEGRSEAGEIEWFAAFGNEDRVFDEYVKTLAERFGVPQKNSAPRVWCSWYSLYMNISEGLLCKTFDLLGDLPFDMLQVDDGWQKDIGDWEPNEKFPSGMQALAEKIKSTGRRAGLWLAPLLVSKSSRLYREHRDWILRDENGKFVSAGFNYWGYDLYALDSTHPGVISWLVALMGRLRRWGFDYVKLDFLYAGAMQGKRYKDSPREAALRETISLMRNALGEGAFLLTCGAPIFAALGVCDAIRIGPDVSHKWENRLYEHYLQNFDAPGARNAIRTTVNRLWLKPLIHIDPDVCYFAAKENMLEEEHKAQLRDLALLCGFKAASDLPHWLTEEEREQLRAFLLAEPKTEKIGRYVYKLDGRVADFSSAVKFPPRPKGLAAWLGAFMGWAGNFKFAIKLFLSLDNVSKRRRALRM